MDKKPLIDWQGQPIAPPKQKRHTPDPFTVLHFCSTCGVEVYRRQHVRVKTQKVLTEIRQNSRLALFQHVQRVQHSGRLTGDLWVNERFGDDAFEIAATEEKAAPHTQASNVLRGLGLLNN